MRTLRSGLVLALTFAALSAAQATEYNRRTDLPPRAQAAIQGVIAKSRAMRSGSFVERVDGDSLRQRDETPKCGEDVGGVIVDRRPGGEKVVVVTRDIFNTGGRVDIGSDCR